MRRVLLTTLFVLITSLPASASVIQYAPGLDMDTYLPAAPTKSAVLAVHGGGWYAGTRASMARFCTEVVVPLGYACFAPDYTLSGVSASPQARIDLQHAVKYVRSDGYRHIAGAGFSAGGNLVGTLADRGLFVTSVLWSAPTDLQTLPDWAPPACGCTGVIHQFAPTRMKRIAASPALHTPVGSMLVVNSNHELIPVSQAIEMDAAIPGEHHLTILPGHAHALSYFDVEAPETRDWLASHLG